MCIFLCMGGNNTTWMNAAVLVTCIRNLWTNRGPVSRILKGYVGLSATIFTDLCTALFADDPAIFLLMLAIIPFLVCLSAILFLRESFRRPPQPTRRKRPSSSFLSTLSLSSSPSISSPSASPTPMAVSSLSHSTSPRRLHRRHACQARRASWPSTSAATSSLASLAVEASFGDDAQVEKRAMMRMGGVAMPMTMDMGLRWSPGPKVLMKGLMLFMSITLIKMAIPIWS